MNTPKTRKPRLKKAHAAQISKLLADHNGLTVSAASILQNSANYAFELVDDTVIAVEKGRLVQWYQFELSHLVVHPEYRGKGLAAKIRNELVVRAKHQGARVLQCTVRDNNEVETKVMTKAGFIKGVSFTNPNTGHEVTVWQKAIE